MTVSSINLTSKETPGDKDNGMGSPGVVAVVLAKWGSLAKAPKVATLSGGFLRWAVVFHPKLLLMWPLNSPHLFPTNSQL